MFEHDWQYSWPTCSGLPPICLARMLAQARPNLFDQDKVV